MGWVILLERSFKMEIRVYTVSDNPNKLTKTLGTAIILNGDLKEDVDLLNPVITVDYTYEPGVAPNYCYIPQLRRYYFIMANRLLKGRLSQVTLHVDVLMTYSAKIRAGRGYIVKTESPQGQLSDASWPMNVNRSYTRMNFTGGDSANFTNDGLTGKYILTVAG